MDSTTTQISTAMNPISRALWNALIVCLGAAIKQTPIIGDIHDPKPYLITYGTLIVKARLVGVIIPKGIGPYLKIVAEECRARGLPPLHALAVSQNSDGSPGIPGDSYDGAGGYKLMEWPKDVILAITGRFPVMF